MNKSKISINDFIFNENAYFFESAVKLDDSFIKQLFSKIISEKKASKNVFQEISVPYKTKSDKVSYSVLVFNYEDQPSFVDEKVVIPPELKYGYILIIQYDKFVAIVKKNISGLKELYEKVDGIDYYVLSRLLVSDITTYEKFTINNMDISDSALRKKALEAIDLRNSLPIAVGNRYVLNSLRLNNKGERFSLSLGTSRINRLAEKIIFDELIQWIVAISKKILAFKSKGSYLDIFPIPEDYASAIGALTPMCVLFVLEDIIKLFEDNRIKTISYKNDGKERHIRADDFLKKLKEFERYIQLGDSEKAGKKDCYHLKNNLDKSLRICLNDKSISCKANKLKNIIMRLDDGSEENIVEYINKKQNYIINFNKPDYIYFCRSLFRDTKLLNIIDSLLEIFQPFPELSKSTSEKGLMKKTLTKFGSDSLFGFIEKYLLKDAVVLVCDDLSDEWADFIAVKNGELIFCNAKHSDSKLSASAFHELVSQTQKNLGKFLATDKEWGSKTKWDDCYSLQKVKTRIKRIRRGADRNKVVDTIINTQKNINFQKKIWLVIDYISKKELAAEFQELKKDPSNYKKSYVVQLLWLITSLVSICSEFGAQINIACKE